MNTVKNESQLVCDACHGSIAAFETLVHLYEPRIQRMLYHMTQDVQLTQDLCQDTFISAYRALPRMVDRDLHFYPWLYRIAFNHMFSERRRHKHVKIFPLSTSVSTDLAIFDECRVASSLDGDFFEDHVIEHELVHFTLAQLSEPLAICLLLEAEGFTYAEIATILHINVPAVRSRISRARKAFRLIYMRLDQEE